MWSRFRSLSQVRYLIFFWQEVEEFDLLTKASNLAYVTLLGIIPSLAATLGLVAIMTPVVSLESSLIEEAQLFVLRHLATGSGEQFILYVSRFLSNLDITKIGITGTIGVFVSLGLLLRQVELALNAIWGVSKPRNPLKRFVTFWTIITVGSLVLGLTIGFLTGFDLNNLNPFATSTTKYIGRRIVPLLAIYCFFFFLYAFVPHCRVKLKPAAYGAVFASLLFLGVSQIYKIYSLNFTSYAAIYGALAAVPIFLVWLYVIWVVILTGALLTYEIQTEGFRRSRHEKIELPSYFEDMIPLTIIAYLTRKFTNSEKVSLEDLRKFSDEFPFSHTQLKQGLGWLEEVGYIHSVIDQKNKDLAEQTFYYLSKPADELLDEKLFEELSGRVLRKLEPEGTYKSEEKQVLENLLKKKQAMNVRAFLQAKEL